MKRLGVSTHGLELLEGCVLSEWVLLVKCGIRGDGMKGLAEQIDVS
jgi:lipoate-protein ligase B